jgi:hypothetical protein
VKALRLYRLSLGNELKWFLVPGSRSPVSVGVTEGRGERGKGRKRERAKERKGERGKGRKRERAKEGKGEEPDV